MHEALTPGRYLISVNAVKEEKPEDVIIHDMHHLHESCNTDQIKARSRFNDLEWGLAKGYRKCRHCFGVPA